MIGLITIIFRYHEVEVNKNKYRVNDGAGKRMSWQNYTGETPGDKPRKRNPSETVQLLQITNSSEFICNVSTIPIDSRNT